MIKDEESFWSLRFCLRRGETFGGGLRQVTDRADVEVAKRALFIPSLSPMGDRDSIACVRE